MLKDWYAPLECEGAGEPTLKPYPCCGSTHASVNRAILLATTHDIRPNDIETVDVMPHRRRLPHTNNPDPHGALEAKFSIQYCVARALTDRAVRLNHFENDAENDPPFAPCCQGSTPARIPACPMTVRINGFGGRRPYQRRPPPDVPRRRLRTLWSRRPYDEPRRTLDQILRLRRTFVAESVHRPLFDKLSSVADITVVTELTTLMR